MSARDELECAIWRGLARMASQKQSQGEFVDGALAAADAYALAVANHISDTPAATAARREILCQAVKQEAS